jgi:hypothetical protein
VWILYVLTCLLFAGCTMFARISGVNAARLGARVAGNQVSLLPETGQSIRVCCSPQIVCFSINIDVDASTLIFAIVVLFATHYRIHQYHYPPYTIVLMKFCTGLMTQDARCLNPDIVCSGKLRVTKSL